MTDILTLQQESTASDVLSLVEIENLNNFHTPVELAGFFDVTILNDNLIRLHVRAFGWEVNRNNFLFNKTALLAEHADALGRVMPAWKSFENQLVNANHLMADNKNSRVDKVIGFIEDAELKEDGVYLTLIVWKRTMSDDQIEQIREGKVSVSMEVTYNNPLVIVDGESYPPSTITYDPRTTVRTMADDSVLSFVGIAILFDGIKPGFESQEVLVTENAALEDGSLVSRDTHTEVSMDLKEMEAEVAALKEKETELASALAAKDTELAAATEELNAKRAEIDKLYAELDSLRQKAFDETVAACFDLGKLSATTAAWLLDMIRWSGCIEETACKLAEIAGACKVAPAAVEVANVADCADGTCGECSACKTKKANAESAAAEEAAAVAAAEAAAAAEGAANTPAGEEGGAPAADPAAHTETAAVVEAPAPIVSIAGEGGNAPVYGHRHL